MKEVEADKLSQSKMENLLAKMGIAVVCLLLLVGVFTTVNVITRLAEVAYQKVISEPAQAVSVCSCEEQG